MWTLLLVAVVALVGDRGVIGQTGEAELVGTASAFVEVSMRGAVNKRKH